MCARIEKWGQASHEKGKHGISEVIQADIINSPDAIFIGMNDSQTPCQVTVFYRDGDVVITQDNDFTLVITTYYSKSGIKKIGGGKVKEGESLDHSR